MNNNGNNTKQKNGTNSQSSAAQIGNGLLIAIIISSFIAVLLGFSCSAKGNPIENLMLYLQSGGETQGEEEYIDPDSGIVDDETDDSDAVTTDVGAGSDTTQDPDVTGPADTDPPEPGVDPYDRVNDPDYFKDALFIGDSRTVGFYSYARVPDAKYFAATSMSVFNVFSRKAETPKSSDTLEGYLKKNKFGKIYIMLGINEIGYPSDNIVNKYKSLIETLRKLQPDAIILIQSNMHVTKKKSDASPKTFNNKRIDALNSKLSQLADGEKIFYLDFASVFDDASGALNPEYTGDGVHFKAKYYKLWRDWIVSDGKR